MVNNKIAQRAVAAGLSGLMAFGAAAPAALAFSVKEMSWYKTNDNGDSTFFKRLAGSDRYGTMKEIVKAYNEFERVTGISLARGLKTQDVYQYHSTVVLASGDNFPDALAANGLAGYLTNMNLTVASHDSVPVILTKAGSLSAEAKDLLEGMQVQNVIIMGGTAAVSQDVEDAIAKMGIGVTRVAGADRQETSLKALQRINGNWKDRKGTYDLIIATGDNYADALSISPYAYRMGTPVLLTKKDGTLTDAQVQAIKDNDEIHEIIIVGGTSAVSDAVMGQIGTLKKNGQGVSYQRIAGADRYETSAKIAEFELDEWRSYWSAYKDFTFNHVMVATGENFPDALAGGQLAGGYFGDDIVIDDFDYDYNWWSPCPLLLVKDGDTQAERMIASYLGRYDITSGTSTWSTFGSYLETIRAWYNNTAEYNALLADWYRPTTKSYFISEDALRLNGDITKGVFVSNSGQADYDFNLTNRAGVYSASDFFVDGYRVEVTGLWDDATAKKAYSGTANLFVTYKDPITGVECTAGNFNLVVATEVPADGSTTAVSRDDLGWGIFNQKGWEGEIIRYEESDADFYGIILGGKQAVSNDKRDDLNKVVERVAGTEDIFTVYSKPEGTVVYTGADGIRRNYEYMKLVDTGVSALAGGTYKGRRGDVFELNGGSHLVALYGGDGMVETWIYYYGKTNAGYTKDWNV